jgi:putative spermidine/putrescine transport system permease protein
MKKAASALLLAGPAMLVMVFFFATLATVLSLSVVDKANHFSLENITAFATDSQYRNYLFRSIWIAGYTTAVVLVAGYPIAYVMSRGSRHFSSAVTLILAIQFFAIYVVKMYGWMLVLGNNGVINRSLKALGLIDAPIKLMYNELGVAIGLFASALPLMVFPISSVLQNVSSRFEEAGRGLGASPLRTFWHITLPLSTPGVVSGAVLTFVFCFTAYLAPSLLGGGTFKMIGNLIYDQAVVGFNYRLSGGAAVVTLAVSLLVVFTISRLGTRAVGGEPK